MTTEQRDTVRVFYTPKEEATTTREAVIATRVCALIDELFEVEQEKRPFYEPSDLGVHFLWDATTPTYEVELQSFFGCGNSLEDALLGLESNLKHQVKTGGR